MKVAPLHHEAVKRSIHHDILHTGQHYDKELSLNYEKEFELPSPIINLYVGSRSQAAQLARVIEGVDAQIQEKRPDFILVYGDTNSTAGGAIAAAKNYIPLVHVEAGLREFTKDVPEEINKLLIDSVSDIFCCPTEKAVDQLHREGKKEGVMFTGDIVYDHVLRSREKIDQTRTILTEKLKDKPFYFVTLHREVNTASKYRLQQCVQAIVQLPHQVVFSIHPRTKKALMEYNLWNDLLVDRIYTVDSRPFYETQWLIANAKMTLTDSGGVSKESYFHKTPCLLLDDQIEWQELVDSAWIKICGASKEKILNAVELNEIPQSSSRIFGDGNTAAIIMNAIIEYYASRK